MSRKQFTVTLEFKTVTISHKCQYVVLNMMLNFRKTSVSFKDQIKKLFRNEKKFRKSGLVEEADFDFQITDNGFNVDPCVDNSVDMDTSVIRDLTFNKRLSTKFWMVIWLYCDCDRNM